MIDIAYIVRDEIVNKMNNVINVASITGNDITISGCLKWASILKVVTDNLGNEYKITAIDRDNKILTVNPLGAYTFTGNVINLNTPYFFTGTPRATNSEWLVFSDDEREKTPFIWMVEPTSEQPLDDKKYGGVERKSNIRIVFLDDNNAEQWLTLDTHDNRLQSLYNMRSEFVRVINSNSIFESIDDSSMVNLTKFGTETSNGFENNIIDSNLTGIDCRFSLSIYRKCN